MAIPRALKIKNQIVEVDIKRIYAWCIVPYDSLKRSAKDRISMLKRLGIKKYAYDWREEHLPYMAKELKLAKQNDLSIVGIWMWIDGNFDSINTLSNCNLKVFNILEEVDYQGQIWVSFEANFFENLSNSEAVKKGVEMIAYLSKKANAIKCKIALYNHGGWFGEPINQIKIIEALPKQDLGIVYNFHHAHKHIDTFPEMATLMLPYLWNVNLNGLKKEGPKILRIGEGDYEKKMINLLLEKGYKGDFGILGHVEDADAERILKANLNGLKNNTS
ncbi:sugar phosphate isomerase/epimerase [Maribacter vaceletii]|uniref:Sugar phosphate isomerase/epimerase n=1 Tax=Maribacter vaceletii TaxID=1206816 RepID=A0A495EDE9_9FLAO|nr:AP endonuclease [Maribacter vaceletii]RKR14918.1 sugar phosphate isomerase/epimerase [Maribacter vaceletii]